jgi:hypothetical protein
MAVSDSNETSGTAPTGQESIGTAEAPAKRFSVVRTFGTIIVAAVAAVVAIFVTQNKVADAKVGDCVPKSVITSTKHNATMKTVDCTAPDASHRVAGVVENKTEADYNADPDGKVCDPFPNTDWVLWISTKNSGRILCLEPLKK